MGEGLHAKTRSRLMAQPILPPALENFVDLFNKGAYWESHEALEPEWKRIRSPFYHGLILYASAWVHHERGNRTGVLAQLAKAEPELEKFTPGYLGIDVAGILGEGADLRAGRPAAAPMILTDLRLLRGDEVELEEVD
jgi:predicted metal-dependent hydrolase